MLRHDFYHKLANFTKLKPLHLCPLIIVVKNVISVFGNLNKYINQCRHNKAKGQDLVPVQHFPEHPITPHDEHGFSQSNVSKSNNKIVQKPLIGGGKLSTKFEGQELATMGISGVSTNSLAGCQIYKFVNYMAQANVEAHSVNQKTFICYCTLDYLAPQLTQAQLRLVAHHHNIFIGTGWTSEQSRSALLAHECNGCPRYLSLFKELQVKHKMRDNTSISRQYRAKQSESEKVLVTAKNTKHVKLPD